VNDALQGAPIFAELPLDVYFPLCHGSWSAAGSSALRATVLGRVTDSSGAAVAGAKITVRNAGTELKQTVSTDDQGRYTVPDLDVGTYEVDADRSGFKRVVHSGIALTVGNQLVVDMVLEVGTADRPSR